MKCTRKYNYKVNVINYTADNMDSDIKVEMESTHAGHLITRVRTHITQTCMIQELLVAASERKESDQYETFDFSEDYRSVRSNCSRDTRLSLKTLSLLAFNQ